MPSLWRVGDVLTEQRGLVRDVQKRQPAPSIIKSFLLLFFKKEGLSFCSFLKKRTTAVRFGE
jgi:hypothetical protein